MGSGRRVAAVLSVAAVLAGAAGAGAAAVASSHHPGGVSFVDGTPADLETLATSTWSRFLRAFPARRGCVPGVAVRAAWRLDDRASYDPDRRLVTVRVPGTAPNLQATLVHEFAHHLDFTCREERAVRPAFLAAQGFAPGTPWLRGPTWDRTPSEQFAEAVVQVVLGPSPEPRVLVSRTALELIRRWGTGR